MLKRLEVFLIIAVFIVITAIVLIVYSMQREQEYKTHSITTQKTIVNGAAYAINMKLLEKHRHVQLFVNEYARYLLELYNNTTNEKIVNDLKTRLEQRFPGFFTFTITDKKGIPKLQNIDSLVGHVCQTDLNNFAKHLDKNTSGKRNKVVIHPQPFNYHYDIMAPLYTSGKTPSIFFVSFYPNEIANILKTHSLPGQQLILVRQSDSSLIEITAKGTRDKIKRDITLNKDELKHIHAFANIPDTDWRLINLSDSKREKEYIKGLWKEAIIIIVIVALALILMFAFLMRASRK